MELKKTKNEYFQKQVNHLLQTDGYELLEEKEGFASFLYSRRNMMVQIELVDTLMDICEQRFSVSCFVIKITSDVVDRWYVYLLIDECPISLDLRIPKTKDPYSFQLDVSQWHEDNLDRDKLLSLTEHVHTKAKTILAWFEDWMVNHSPYRLYFVTQTCDISYSEDAQTVKSGPKGEL